MPPDLSQTPTHDLLRLYSAILTTLTTRGVIRTRNAPSGDLAEYLTRLVYGGTLAKNSKATWDVQTTDGRLLQVKSRVLTPGEPPGNYSPFRRLRDSPNDAPGYDAAVLVHFNATTYDIDEAIEVPSTVITQLTTPDPHVAATRLTVANVRKARTAADLVATNGGPPTPFTDKTTEFQQAMAHLSEPPADTTR